MDATSAVSTELLDAFNADGDDDEDELLSVVVDDTSYVPRSLLKRMGLKLQQAEEGGDWSLVAREGAAEVSDGGVVVTDNGCGGVNSRSTSSSRTGGL